MEDGYTVYDGCNAKYLARQEELQSSTLMGIPSTVAGEYMKYLNGDLSLETMLGILEAESKGQPETWDNPLDVEALDSDLDSRDFRDLDLWYRPEDPTEFQDFVFILQITLVIMVAILSFSLGVMVTD